MAAIPKCRILVVDDEPFVCDAMKMMLAFDGHEVETARDAREALALYQKGKYDVIITDFAMPSMRGDELAAAIKAQDPNQPVVLITAYAEVLSMSDRPLQAIDHLMSKPFLLEDMRLAISKVTACRGPPQAGG